jgi:hypothetical protein
MGLEVPGFYINANVQNMRVKEREESRMTSGLWPEKLGRVKAEMRNNAGSVGSEN